MKIATFFLNTMFIAIMCGVAGLFLAPMLPIQPSVQLRIVESGSMEPQIMTGSIVVITPRAAYHENDIITFKSHTGNVPTTHRIVSIDDNHGRTLFTTKGDANEDVDTYPTDRTDVMGRVLFAVPYIGYILDFARQPLGFVGLIVVPAAIIVFGELQNIWFEIRRRKVSGSKTLSQDITVRFVPSRETLTRVAPLRTDVAGSHRMMDIATPVFVPALRGKVVSLESGVILVPPAARSTYSVWRWLLQPVAVLLFAAVLVSLPLIPTTVSYFNDTETAAENTLRAIALDVVTAPSVATYSFIDGVIEGDATLVLTQTPENSSAPARYSVSIVIATGTSVLCNQLTASSNAPVLYSGPLLGLAAADITFAAPWNIAFSLPSTEGLESPLTCVVDVVFTAWAAASSLDQGYSDQEKVRVTFSSIVTSPVTPLFFSAALFDEVTDTVSTSTDDMVLPDAPTQVLEDSVTPPLPTEEPITPPSEESVLPVLLPDPVV